MPKKNSAHLFKLIRSLTKAEKRHFKIFVSRRTAETKCIELFDAIANQGTYNENKLRGKKFGKQLPKLKHRLHELILKSLNALHVSGSVSSSLMQQIHRIQILHDKGLYAQCEKILLKAKRLAKLNEQYELLLELYAWEVKISKNLSDNVKKHLEEIQDEKVAVTAKMQNTDQLKLLAYQMYCISVTQGTKLRSKNEIQEMKNILNHPLLYDESKALTKEAKRSFYYTYALFYSKTGNAKKCYDCCKKVVELFESSFEYKKKHVDDYIFSLNNMAFISSTLAKYDEVITLIERMKAIPELLGKCTDDIKTKIFERSANLELDMYLSSCQFEKGIPCIPSIEKGLETFQEKSGNQYKTLLIFNCTLLYFIMQDYHNALVWNNKIINDATADIRQDVYCYARLLNLLIHYELGNEAVLENLVKSSERYIEKKYRLYKTEVALLNFIRKKIPATFTGKERIAAFKELKTELEEITKDPFEKNVLKSIDYIAWLESKIEGKTFAEVLRGKLPACSASGGFGRRKTN